ncbi:hypothetical protein TrRE_jg1628, partial [Triparma retinervis]
MATSTPPVFIDTAVFTPQNSSDLHKSEFRSLTMTEIKDAMVAPDKQLTRTGLERMQRGMPLRVCDFSTSKAPNLMAEFDAENVCPNSAPEEKGKGGKMEEKQKGGGRVLAMAKKIKERLQPLTPTFGQKTGE